MSGLFFEDLSVGQSAELTRVVDEKAIQGFADVSGDHNPVHLDEAFAATTQFKTRIAHGMLSAAYISALIAGKLPATHAQYLARCRKAGQARPTPLLLRYGAGDYNCLHQDLYGELSFPLQAVFLLSEPGADFEGGELMLVEQRPRMQSKGRVVPLRAGDGAVFAVNHRPAQGRRGYYRAAMRHGVSEIRRGERLTLGIIFHDAA